MASASPRQEGDFFSDIETDFTRNPVTNDVMRIKNVESISRSIRNIVLTEKGERMLVPGFGSNVRSYLFENDTPFNRFVLQKEILYTLRAQEPRAEIINVRIFGDIDANELRATIEFTPINSVQAVSLDVVLERSR